MSYSLDSALSTSGLLSGHERHLRGKQFYRDATVRRTLREGGESGDKPFVVVVVFSASWQHWSTTWRIASRLRRLRRAVLK